MPVLVISIGIEDSLPATALALNTPPRPATESCGWPVMSSTTLVSTLASSAAARIVTGYWPAFTVLGGRTLSLTSLLWPASIGIELSSWLP